VIFERALTSLDKVGVQGTVWETFAADANSFLRKKNFI
jgi:hypothetical protein